MSKHLTAEINALFDKKEAELDKRIKRLKAKTKGGKK